MFIVYFIADDEWFGAMSGNIVQFSIGCLTLFVFSDFGSKYDDAKKGLVGWRSPYKWKLFCDCGRLRLLLLHQGLLGRNMEDESNHRVQEVAGPDDGRATLPGYRLRVHERPRTCCPPPAATDRGVFTSMGEFPCDSADSTRSKLKLASGLSFCCVMSVFLNEAVNSAMTHNEAVYA